MGFLHETSWTFVLEPAERDKRRSKAAANLAHAREMTMPHLKRPMILFLVKPSPAAMWLPRARWSLGLAGTCNGDSLGALGMLASWVLSGG